MAPFLIQRGRGGGGGHLLRKISVVFIASERTLEPRATGPTERALDVLGGKC